MNMIRDLHEIPRFKDSISFLYVENAKIERKSGSIVCIDKEGITNIPCASLILLMLGPGTSITHDAVKTATENGCLLSWTGQEGVRLYAFGSGKTRKSERLIHQANLISNTDKRLEIIKKMYRYRFPDNFFDEGKSLNELRGMEGFRVRSIYSNLSKEHGVKWSRRKYNRDRWCDADPLNKAISCANSCLYGIVHSAILTMGYSPALGFIHTGKDLSFVYDIADLYKTELSIPIAFKVVAEGTGNLEKRVRLNMRTNFKNTKLLSRIIPEIDMILEYKIDDKNTLDYDSDSTMPSPLWDAK